MDDSQPHEQYSQYSEDGNALIATLPRRTLLVLCGPAGCGKSTFASQLVTHSPQLGLRPTSIVSSDYCRALVCDDETNQEINADTFDLFHFIIYKRMLQSVFTIADSTALRADARRRMLGLAHRHNYATCLLIFNLDAATCIQRDQQRARSVGPEVITYQMGFMPKVIQDTPFEGWNQLHVFNTQPTNFVLEILPDLLQNR